MLGYYRNIQPGEVLEGYPTDAHNAFFQTSQRMAAMGRPALPPGMSSGSSVVPIEVFNKSGADIDARFPILRLTKPLLTPDDNEGIVDDDGDLWEGDTPDAETQIADIAVMQAPIANDEPGWGVLLGPTWCDVDITDEAHTHAAPIDGDDTKLASGTVGARIRWKPEGTGVKRCKIIRGGGGSSGGGVSIQYGRANETILGLLAAPEEPETLTIDDEEYPEIDPIAYPVAEAPVVVGRGEFILYETVPIPPWDDPDEDPETDPPAEWYPPPWPTRLQEALEDPDFEPEPRVPENFKKVTWENALPGAIIKNSFCIAINGKVISASPITIRSAPEEE
jgi:hypothetical protein